MPPESGEEVTIRDVLRMLARIDTRVPIEYETYLDTLHIEYADLRERFAELDLTKPIKGQDEEVLQAIIDLIVEE